MMTNPDHTISTVDFLNSLTAPGRQTIAIRLDEIHPDPDQPRKSLAAIDGIITPEDQLDLELLADDIFEHGLHQPITVEEMRNGDYRIAMGERRWRAVRLNREKGRPNSETIECFVRQDLKGPKLKFAQLAENLQRQDLTELETATFLKKLLVDFPDLQKQQLAKLLKKPNAYISRILSLLDPQWKHVVDAGIITYASLLEQFKALPEEAREALMNTAKSEERALTSGDLRKARDAAKAPKAPVATSAEHTQWQLEQLRQQGGSGLTDQVMSDMQQYVQSETRPGETYRYQPEGRSTQVNAQVSALRDTGGELSIPHGVGALNAAMLNDKRELKLSMDQLEMLLKMDCFDSKGHIVSVMLPIEELRNAVRQLGSLVPEDDHLLAPTLIQRINELNK